MLYSIGRGELVLHTKRGNITLPQYAEHSQDPIDSPNTLSASDQRLLILEQLQQGRLTVDEAEVL